jgi:phytoene synthase
VLRNQFVGNPNVSIVASTALPLVEASTLLKHVIEQTVMSEPQVLPTHTAEVSLAQAYQYCKQLTQENSRSFYFSSQLLPADKRRSIQALYAFCRCSDDLVDQNQQQSDSALVEWVRMLRAKPPNDHAVLLAWHDVVQRYRIPQRLSDELLAGVAMDLLVNRYETFCELWLYCYRVASVVGLMAMEIIGYDAGAEPYAIKLGMALQMTNILRDVGEDAQRGRIYLPQEDMRRFGLRDEDILAGRLDDRFREMMRFQIQRTDALYEAAWPGIALLSSDSRFAIGAAAQVYRGILRKIEANDYDVFGKRAYTSGFEKLACVPTVFRQLRALPPANEVLDLL